ncbi:Gfo/Idh/MocA family oxidoreductase [Dubosiella newyorkensis]|uniref:Gfo/Idh/MocA family oxidoreductase n=1 Tax=Dubosiella newyorkensis TaxID=1862672 RepID=UPI00248C5CCF|nr:Gfo/Idh/MocA family oxidoreductase [Dubosiella newyorkensis]
MIKVITYGTYDLLHHGHIRLLERAKELGNYLIVGVTADDFDKTRGKINVQQSLMERIEAVRATGLADEIIVEEYEGQKIDDIRRYDIDIFTVGSDWKGKFDYLNEYCKVVYLDRTEGVSSSDIRSEQRKIRLGIIGDSPVAVKYARESQFVNGIEVVSICTSTPSFFNDFQLVTNDYEKMLKEVDAVYIVSRPTEHYQDIKTALEHKKHILCESPISVSKSESIKLFKLAKENGCILMDAIKTAYATAFARLILLAKEGKIGEIYSVDAVCTSLRPITEDSWNSISAWGPTAMLPIFDILGTGYRSKNIASLIDENGNDQFTKIDFSYNHAVASLKVGKGVKSEGELVISGTKGYIYVPAPWWKTDYFEIRYEDASQNRRYFYQLDGEGIRYELVAFVKAIISKKDLSNISQNVSETICEVIEDFYNRKEMILI